MLKFMSWLAPADSPPQPAVPPTSQASFGFAVVLKFVVASVLLLAAFFGICELYCRFVLGLGDPPLYQADSAIQYVLQPSKTYYRFHRRFSFNRYSMRSDDFPPQKSSPSEVRILAVGDSVLYGARRIDQDDLDTEILKRKLHQRCRCPVVVGNVSAEGWGPPNELAYLQRYGTFDADVLILELSSSDYADAPAAAPVVGVSPQYPDKKPPLALVDFFETDFEPRFLHRGTVAGVGDFTPESVTPSELAIAECREAERAIFQLARAHKARVVLLQHLSLPELRGKYYRGYYANQEVAQQEGVPYLDDAEMLRARLEAGENPFYGGDPIHLNWAGQKVLAAMLQRAVDLAESGEPGGK